MRIQYIIYTIYSYIYASIHKQPYIRHAKTDKTRITNSHLPDTFAGRDIFVVFKYFPKLAWKS